MRVPGHYTGRTCDDPQCDGRLIDSIINFGENLPEDELTKSFNESEIADLCIAMGSSLTVTPAAHIPKVSDFMIILFIMALHHSMLVKEINIW
jgi:NAD-dependent SIR2 family protein deacetylase